MKRNTNNSNLDKSKRIQNKDVSTLAILEHIRVHGPSTLSDILRITPSFVPKCVVLSKMYNLLRKGYLNGCACGCRGDFTLTTKGGERIQHLVKARSRAVADYLVDFTNYSIVNDARIAADKGYVYTADALLRICLAGGYSRADILSVLYTLRPLRPFLPTWLPTLRYVQALRKVENGR